MLTQEGDQSMIGFCDLLLCIENESWLRHHPRSLHVMGWQDLVSPLHAWHYIMVKTSLTPDYADFLITPSYQHKSLQEFTATMYTDSFFLLA